MNEHGIESESRKRKRADRRRSGVVGLGVWLIVSMSACAWVELTPQAAAVKLAPNEAAVADCQHVGGVRAQTRARVGLFSRSPEKVAEELATMAKNDAVELKGNTVLAEGRPSIDGAQRFLVYRCPAPSN